MVFNIKEYYCHGLGGYEDKDNGKTSYYSTRSSNYDESKDYVITPDSKMEIVSLERLKYILKVRAILSKEKFFNMKIEANDNGDKFIEPLPNSREKYFLTASHGPQLHNFKEICISKRIGCCYDGESAFYCYSQSSLSILIKPIIEKLLLDNLLRKDGDHCSKMMDGEFRINDEISINYFAGILLPISLLPSFKYEYRNVDNIEDYIKYRIEEVVLINNLLKLYNIDLPIIDTHTGEVIESRDKILKLVNCH